MKRSCLLYGEGVAEKKLIYALVDLANFKFHIKDRWEIQKDNSSGGSPELILRECISAMEKGQVALCFCDMDVIEKELIEGCCKKKGKNIFGKIKKKVKEIDKVALESGVIMIWQNKTLEDEIVSIFGPQYEGVAKSKLLNMAIKRSSKFIGTKYYRKILKALDVLWEG